MFHSCYFLIYLKNLLNLKFIVFGMHFWTVCTIVLGQFSEYTFGMHVHYDCVEGYEMFGINGDVKTCLANGSFSLGQILCEPVSCQEYYPILNGMLRH